MPITSRKQEAVQRYWNTKKKRKIWAVRLTHAEAVMVLHLPLDDRDTDGDGKYWIKANNPLVDVVVTAHSFDSGSQERLSSRSFDARASIDWVTLE